MITCSNRLLTDCIPPQTNKTEFFIIKVSKYHQKYGTSIRKWATSSSIYPLSKFLLKKQTEQIVGHPKPHGGPDNQHLLQPGRERPLVERGQHNFKQTTIYITNWAECISFFFESHDLDNRDSLLSGKGKFILKKRLGMCIHTSSASSG